MRHRISKERRMIINRYPVNIMLLNKFLFILTTKTLLKILLFAMLLFYENIFASADLVKDSKLRIDSPKYYPDEAWQHWIYNSQKKDYDGNSQPKNFILYPGTGFRMEDMNSPKQDIDAILMEGKKDGDVIDFQSSNAFLNKIKTDSIKCFINAISTLDGAYYEKGKLFLVGQKRETQQQPASFLPEDIIVAFRSIANSPCRGASVDIIETYDPSGTGKYGIINFEGLIENSHLGQVLFESDRLLKTISLGCDNISFSSLQLTRWWNRNKFDYKKMPTSNTTEEWHKFWFTADEMEIEDDHNSDIMRFNNNKITALTQKMKIKNSEAEYYFEKESKSETGNFTANLNENFQYYRNEYPVLNEFIEISKLIAIAKWFYNKGVVIKFNKEDVKGFYNRYTPLKTPIIKVSRTRTIKNVDLDNYTETEFVMNSVGGINLKTYKFKSKKLSKYKEMISTDGKHIIFRLL